MSAHQFDEQKTQPEGSVSPEGGQYDRNIQAQLSQQFEVNPITISKWKSEFLENMAVVFDRSSGKQSDASDSLDPLYAQIGQLKVELDFLKKSARKLGIPEKEWKP